MKIHLQISTLRHTHTRLFGACFCSLALIFSRALCLAQCPPDIEPTLPAQETLLPAYQPSAYTSGDTTKLRRLRFTPDTATWGPGPYPTVLTIHPGEFKEYDDHGTPQQRWADYDLSQAGFLVFSIEYRLAPDNLIVGQHVHDDSPEGIASGRPPQQSNDVKQEILAARADSQCNGTVFLVGGSAGGTHALWAALDPNATVPGWDSSKMPKAVVGLSGVYDLPLRNPTPPPAFIGDVNNYTNTMDPLNFVQQEAEYSASPISYVYMATNQTAPVRLYATSDDPVPYQQAGEMWSALFAKGVDVIEYTMVDSSRLHAFHYWHTTNPQTGICVSTEVIAFLNAHR